MLFCKCGQKLECGRNIVKGPLPAAAVSHAAVLDIEGGDSSPGQRGTHVAGVREIVLRSPEATVDNESHRMSALIAGNSQVNKLVRMVVIRNASISGWWSLRQNVFAGHAS